MTQFVPHQPPVMVKAEIEEKELKVLKFLRKIQFGKCSVHKADGLLVRIVKEESEKL